MKHSYRHQAFVSAVDWLCIYVLWVCLQILGLYCRKWEIISATFLIDFVIIFFGFVYKLTNRIRTMKLIATTLCSNYTMIKWCNAWIWFPLRHNWSSWHVICLADNRSLGLRHTHWTSLAFWLKSVMRYMFFSVGVFSSQWKTRLSLPYFLVGAVRTWHRF